MEQKVPWDLLDDGYEDWPLSCPVQGLAPGDSHEVWSKVSTEGPWCQAAQPAVAPAPGCQEVSEGKQTGLGAEALGSGGDEGMGWGAESWNGAEAPLAPQDGMLLPLSGRPPNTLLPLRCISTTHTHTLVTM